MPDPCADRRQAALQAQRGDRPVRQPSAHLLTKQALDRGTRRAGDSRLGRAARNSHHSELGDVPLRKFEHDHYA